MFDFIDNFRNELLSEFIDVLDLIALGSLNLYDKITENLMVILRSQLNKSRCEDNFLV